MEVTNTPIFRMTIFINPDRHRDSISKLLQTVDCPGLEELTGCDLCISAKPVKPTSDLDWHIEHNSLFIQVKVGYDIFSFDALKSTASRLHKAGIAKRNSYVLFIGRCYPDNEGKAVIDGKQYGKYTYELFEELQGLIEARCCHFRQIPSLAELPIFISAIEKARVKVEREGGREHYEGSKTTLVDAEPLQDIITIEKTSPRYVLVNGLDGFGPQLAKDTLDYVTSLGRAPTLYNFLDCLTALTPKGKRMHPVKNWGKASVAELRFILGLQSSYETEGYQGEPFVQNLSTCLTNNHNFDPLSEHYRGMRATLEAFRAAGQSGITSGKELLFAVERAASALWVGSQDDYQNWAKSLYVDDWLREKYPQIYQEFIGAKS